MDRKIIGAFLFDPNTHTDTYRGSATSSATLANFYKTYFTFYCHYEKCDGVIGNELLTHAALMVISGMIAFTVTSRPFFFTGYNCNLIEPIYQCVSRFLNIMYCDCKCGTLWSTFVSTRQKLSLIAS